MDDVVNTLAREMADAIAAAVAGDQRVEACRARARAAGYELQVTLEAVIGFAPVPAADEAAAQGGSPPRAFEVSAHDRRFLRSLRISADEAIEEVE